MKKRFAIVLLSGLVFALVSACASAPGGDAGPADAALDPVGTYGFTTTVQGMALEGRLQITGSPGAWGGSIHSDVTGELPLSSVRVEGQQLRLTADTPDGTVYIRMTFTGDAFTGDWTLGADGGSLRGRRLSR